MVEFHVVVAKGMETQVVKHLRRDEEHGVSEIVSAIYRAHNMTWHDKGQIVFVMRYYSHVVHRPRTAAQAEGHDDVREDEVFVDVEESGHLAHNQNARLLDGFHQLFFEFCQFHSFNGCRLK